MTACGVLSVHKFIKKVKTEKREEKKMIECIEDKEREWKENGKRKEDKIYVISNGFICGANEGLEFQD